MQLDIRLPIGLLFSLLGLLLVVSGLVMDKGVYQRSLGINVNLWWGVVLLAFGIVMLLLMRRGAGGVRPAMSTPEGRDTEAREHQLGLEHEPPRRGH
ncbi:MAG TPA: hypothetical protein VFC63_24535 [Blastocatellia bacterium]|nr:hypothetical protein [Blastocatellia bacterium]